MRIRKQNPNPLCVLSYLSTIRSFSFFHSGQRDDIRKGGDSRNGLFRCSRHSPTQSLEDLLFRFKLVLHCSPSIRSPTSTLHPRAPFFGPHFCLLVLHLLHLFRLLSSSSSSSSALDKRFLWRRYRSPSTRADDFVLKIQQLRPLEAFKILTTSKD